MTLRGWLLGAKVELSGEEALVEVPTAGEALGIARLQDAAVRDRLEEELWRQWGSPLRVRYRGVGGQDISGHRPPTDAHAARLG